jgi:TrbL/VirB6 plasmid conjugal transfer protein
MKPTVLAILRGLVRTRRRCLALLFGLTIGLVLLAGPPAGASDVYSNIGPAPQLPPGGWLDRYPLTNYQLDQYFSAVNVGVFSGVDVSGVPAMIAFFIAQVVWLITAFLAYAVITVFAFAFSLDLVNGNGTSGSGALTPVASAIHNLYTHTFGAPWLVAAIVLAGCWAMWKALVQRRYTETAGALAVSLLHCVLAIGIVTQPQRTIAPTSKLSNQLSTAILSLTSEGSIGNEQQAKTAASNQLFSFLVLDPWTVLEFGGIEHCTQGPQSTRSVAVRPLSSNPGQDLRLASQLEAGAEVRAQGKTCINNRNKYASHFLAYPFQSKDRNSEHEALEKGDTGKLPSSDPGKTNGGYRLGKADEPAAEAMGKGGQYQRLLLSIVILLGEVGAFLLLGALALGVILAQLLLLFLLCFAPVALLVGIFPGRGHDFFRAWLGKLAGYLARKVIYSLILAVTLAVSQALADAASNLGWLLAFVLQAAFLWTVFIQRERLTRDLLAATAGHKAAHAGTSRLQNLYYATRLTQIARRPKPSPPPPPAAAGGGPSASPPPEPAPENPPIDSPQEEPA